MFNDAELCRWLKSNLFILQMSCMFFKLLRILINDAVGANKKKKKKFVILL